jgi:hypothetical protein
VARRVDAKSTFCGCLQSRGMFGCSPKCAKTVQLKLQLTHLLRLAAEKRVVQPAFNRGVGLCGKPTTRPGGSCVRVRPARPTIVPELVAERRSVEMITEDTPRRIFEPLPTKYQIS